MTDRQPLPVWRLILGLAVLGMLLLAAVAISPVYIANYRFSQYVRTRAAQASLAGSTPAGSTDDALRAEIAQHAHDLGLPIQARDIDVKHSGTRVQLQVAKYKAQVYRADLHFAAITTK